VTSRRARAAVSSNLSRVLGKAPGSAAVQAATRESFDAYACYWFETFRLRVMSPEQVEERMSFEGRENLDAALRAGKGVVVAVPHMGNWDAAGRWLALNGYRAVSVAEALRPRRLLDLFVRHREELGLEIIVLEKGARVTACLAERLAQNWLVGLVADRDLSGRGIEAEMFGGIRRLPAGPASLSVETGAPLLAAGLYSEAGRWRCVVGAPLEIERTGDPREDTATLTRLMAAEFERAIARHPADWHMFRRAWP